MATSIKSCNCDRLVCDSPELAGNVAQPPPDVVGDVLGQVVNVADGGEAVGQAEAADRVHYVLLQSLLLWRPFLPIRNVDDLLLVRSWPMLVLLSLPSHHLSSYPWLGECWISGLFSRLLREYAEDVNGVENVLETPEIAYPPGCAI